MKYRLPITSSVIQSFWNFVQSTAVILPRSVWNANAIGQLKQILWTNEISRDLKLRCVLNVYTISHKAPHHIGTASESWLYANIGDWLTVIYRTSMTEALDVYTYISSAYFANNHSLTYTGMWRDKYMISVITLSCDNANTTFSRHHICSYFVNNKWLIYT